MIAHLAHWYGMGIEKLHLLRDLPLLLIRGTLAYGFYGPAMQKVSNIDAVIGWFRDSLQIPFPVVNAYMATATECAGVVLLTLGLLTRFISMPLIVVMFVAVATVHWEHGFACGDNGFEIPLYYALMLFTLVVYGPGRLSIDALLWRGREQPPRNQV